MKAPQVFALATVLCVSPASVFATNIQNFPGSGAVANACAGSQDFSGIPFPGSGLGPSDSFMNCVNSGGSPITALSPALAGMSSSGTAAAGLGYIQTGATNTETVSGIPFAGSAAFGGWNDTMTIGGGSGSAYWVVPVHVSGSIDVTGNVSLARMGVAVYENNNLMSDAFAINTFTSMNGGNVNGGIRNGAILFSWSTEAAFYGAVFYTPGDPGNLPSYTLNRTLFFLFPFQYGQQFQFGVYMGGEAGQNSSGAGPITSGFDFLHTLNWQGGGFVEDSNSVVNPNATFLSGSGVNYSQAINAPIPEPATGGLIVLAAGALVWLKRRVR